MKKGKPSLRRSLKHRKARISWEPALCLLNSSSNCPLALVKGFLLEWLFKES